MKNRFWLLLVLVLAFSACQTPPDPEKMLAQYRAELDTFRAEFGGSSTMPDVSFFLFGMGNRTKLLYNFGALTNIQTGDTLYSWKLKKQQIVPPLYSVFLTNSNNEKIVISEDEQGVWIEINGNKQLIPGTESPIVLPDFKGSKYASVLRVLHHEILINIVDSKPLPNFMVYGNPWRRDGAMMAFCLEKTKNVELIKDWALSLTDPYDRNNAGETECDNLGQTLYLLSLFGDSTHPLVKNIRIEASRFEVRDSNGLYLKGRSDFHEAPVYQTKWMKFGLKKLGMADPYQIPAINDNYSALFWWDYTDSYLQGTLDAYDQWKDDKYPYIGWAADHFHKLKRNPISNRDYPLTWETDASQADYNGMQIIDPMLTKMRISLPHTWHAAEIFLYIFDIYPPAKY